MAKVKGVVKRIPKGDILITAKDGRNLSKGGNRKEYELILEGKKPIKDFRGNIVPMEEIASIEYIDYIDYIEENIVNCGTCGILFDFDEQGIIEKDIQYCDNCIDWCIECNEKKPTFAGKLINYQWDEYGLLCRDCLNN